ncbi:MAG: cytochrome b N-terminal domain-containing protein [Gemmatimonadaceae bacterium]|nr:cytochrome b N-terminal domain-containing protein [Gemmatimonadaceae bacterium]
MSRRRPWRVRLRESAVWRSIVRTPPLDSPRGRALRSFGNVFLHLYPVRVPRAVLAFRSTFRLGFIATVLFAILAITGTYLMFFYTPAVTMAYGDMQQLRTRIGFGQLIRNVHRWGAHLMVLVVVLHLVRVFVHGAYKPPRQFNWVIGVGLLLVTLAWSFTGYLLPWDQLAYWAVTVGSDLVHYAPVVGGPLRDFLLGGSTIGQAALLRFYVIHVAVLTIAFLLLMAVHLWRVRKDGLAAGDPPHAHDVTARAADDARIAAIAGAALDIAEPPPTVVTGDGATVARPVPRVLGVVPPDPLSRAARPPDDEVFSWPHLIVRHQVVALATCALVLALGIAFEAPLRDLANPNLTPEPAKAPWYFVGLQELLAHFDPLVAGVLAPAVLVGALVMLPYVDRNPSRRPRDRRLALAIFALLFGALVVLTVIGAFFRGPGWAFVLPWDALYFEP